jgi:hypothetical protein
MTITLVGAVTAASARLVRDRELLEGEDVLPGFAVPLADLLE